MEEYKNGFRKSVNGRIANLIRAGNAPWQCLWQSADDIPVLHRPCNAITGRRYQGGNMLLLMISDNIPKQNGDPRWCTFKQASDQGWKIRRGSKATTIEYWLFKKDPGDEKNGAIRNAAMQPAYPQVFYTNLFHASQIEGIPDYIGGRRKAGAALQVQKLLDASGVKIEHNEDGKMAYSPVRDQLLLPPPEGFPSQKDYYAAALRGMTLWAGHPSRLNYFTADKNDPYAYAKDYLRVQLASWYISTHLGLPFDPRRNKKMETQCVELLQENDHELFRAARDGEKIAEYILNLSRKQENRKTVEKEPEQGKASRRENVPEANKRAKDSESGYEASEGKENARLTAFHAEVRDGQTIDDKSGLEVPKKEGSIDGYERTRENRMDSVAVGKRESDQGFKSRSFSKQSSEIPANGASGGSGRTNQVDLAGERSPLPGFDRGDTSGLSAPGRDGLYGSIPAPDETRATDARTDERGIDAAAADLKDAETVSEKDSYNFRIDELELGKGSPKEKYKNNVAAIRLLKELEAANRQATPEEQRILAKYTGWGALAQAFVQTSYRSSDWLEEYQELKELLTTDEYISARRSILNAHYTSPVLVQGMWKIAQRLGFDGGRVLEPSMGVGNFFGLMPRELAASSRLYGVELDILSGRIAKQLYPNADIAITGFEQKEAPDNFFDLAISNVPFGDYKVRDPRYDKSNYNIHNYFFAKAMDKVRPGGLVMFVTSTGTMQSGRDSELLRRQINSKADLIGAIRLPNTAFKTSAGTEVTADILVLQKRVNENVPSPYAKEWQKLVPSGLKSRYGDRDLEINEYYDAHKNHLLGDLVEDSLYGGNGRLALDGKDIEIEEKLNELVVAFPEGIYQSQKEMRRGQPELVKDLRAFLMPADIRERSYFAHAGKLYQKRNGQGEEITTSDKGKILAFTGLKTALKDLLTDQMNPAIMDDGLAVPRKVLNDQYDEFVKKYGYLNADKNIRSLNEDPEFGMVASIEDYRFDRKSKAVTCAKRDIFTKRTIGAIKQIDHSDTPSDALAASLSERGRVDLQYMSRLLNQSEAEIIQSLKGIIYLNPVSRGWETADEYLGGEVCEKLEIAKVAAEQDALYGENVEALEKVQPKRLEAEEISVSLGVPWIAEKDIQCFADVLLKENRSMEITYSAALKEWIATPTASSAKTSVAATQTWGTNRRSFPELLEDALNRRMPTIYTTDPIDKKKRIVDQKATEAANDKLDKIKQEFEKWIWKDEERTKRLVDFYNLHFNHWRLREYDGSHLTFPGYSLLAPKLNKHQKDAVWRIIQDGNTLLAHCVGAGKTWTMQSAGMEMRRLGICKKPMYVIPSSLIEQFEKEFRQIYPMAKLLTVSAENLPDVNLRLRKSISPEEAEEKRNVRNAKRQEMLSRIAIEDWDGIIISHDMFKRIPMSKEAYDEFNRGQIDQMEEGILEMVGKSSPASKRLRKNLEKAKIRLKNKLSDNINETAKDIVIPFEKLGIDQIFVDEADLFKNLYFPTKMGNISGLSNSDAQRSMDMFVKMQYLSKVNNGRGIVFATGTPISNTIAEMFTMMRYLDMENLKRKGLDYFDNWMSQFAKTGIAIERSPDGNGYRKVLKVSSFVNVPELIKMFRKFADVKQAGELNLDRPRLKNGQRTVISVEANAVLENYIKNEILARAKMIRSGCDPHNDNMLKLTNDLRKASLDMRLINPAIPAEEAAAKLKALVECVFQKYEETQSIQGTQMIFCDLSTPKGVSDKSEEEIDKNYEQEQIEEKNIIIYDEIKKMLQKKGIAKDEIAFIHDAKTKEQKLQMLDAVNEGKIRILLGSTSKMGAGTNAQKRLVAEHHLDCPWRPRDIEQREGRILRQGNLNEEVEIFAYVTQGSYDANMWEKIKNKAMIISQAMSSDLAQRKIEDVDVAVLSYAEAEALASGNPLMAEKTLVDADVMKYSALEYEYHKQVRYNERKIRALPGEIQQAQKAIEKIKIDIHSRMPIAGELFSIIIGGKTYTNRSEAEEALQVLVEKMEFNVMQKIGEIGGFEINLHKSLSENTARIIGEYRYAAKSSSIRSIEYAASNAPEAHLQFQKEALKKMQKELADLQEENQHPFEYRQKLKELLERQKEIAKEIEAQAEDHPQNGQDPTVIMKELSHESLPEDIYKFYLDKVHADNPSVSQKNTDRYIARALNRAGYSEQKIMECLAASDNLKNMDTKQKKWMINKIIFEIAPSRAV